jgi:hypothetical protein
MVKLVRLLMVETALDQERLKATHTVLEVIISKAIGETIPIPLITYLGVNGNALGINLGNKYVPKRQMVATVFI